MANALSVANAFLTLAKERGETLTPMQLLKLVYIAHGWKLGLYHTPLIAEEVQAWQYGPVIPKLYSRIRQFRSNPVTEIAHPDADEALDFMETDLVRQVYEIYGHLSGPALSRLTHAENTPWALTYKPGAFGIVIPNDIIEDHYSQLAAQAPTQ